MNTVSALDENFLSLDSDTSHQAIAILCLLDSIPSVEQIKENLNSALEQFPKLRMKVKAARKSLWVEDENFQLDNHFSVLHCDEEINNESLLNTASKLFSNKLDFSRPLWRLTLLTNGSTTEQHKAAVFFTVHHAFADGLSGLALFDAFCDKHHAAKESNNPLPISTQVKNKLSKYTASFFKLFSEYLRNPGKTPIIGKNSNLRQLTVMEFDLRELLDLKTALRCSLNDIFLTLLTQSVRKYHLMRGAPLNTLRAIMPVNLRGLESLRNLGNHLTGVGVPLPIALRSPEEQLKFITEYIRGLKKYGAYHAYGLFGRLNGSLPKPIRRFFANSQAARTTLICTNVPGPRDNKYFGGSKITSFYPLPALMKNHGIAVGFLSYVDKVCISFVSDPAIIDNPSYFTEALKQSLSELSISSR